jgi:hypothetical protein
MWLTEDVFLDTGDHPAGHYTVLGNIRFLAAAVADALIGVRSPPTFGFVGIGHLTAVVELEG